MAEPIRIAFSPGRMTLHSYAQEQEARERAEAEQKLRDSERLTQENTLESAVLAEFYRYHRIDNTYGSRLLILNPGDKGDKLTGRLQSFSVGQTQEYKALSYVWGEPRFTDMIFIEGKRLAITDSLGAALRRLRPPAGQPQLRIWIDQVCINQKDTVERSQQVRLMHTIFKDASQVLVWLGADPAGHASRAFQTVEALRSIFDDRLLSKLCKAKGGNCDWIPAEYWKSLRELTKLPWFRRAWIPQEIGTDTDALVYWGSEKIQWETLHGGMRQLETQGWELKKKHKVDVTAVTILFRRFSHLSTDKTAAQARRSFIYQLCLSAKNVATDPRDYVFSQLGHPSAWIQTEEAMIIQPDYDNTVAAVYHEIAIRALTTDSTLMVLNAVSDNGEARPPLPGGRSLPTWVPRWDAGRFANVIGFPGRYNTSGSRRSGITKASFEDGYETLVAKGLIVDVIGNVMTKFTSSSFNPDSSKKEFIQAAWRLCRAKPAAPQSSTRDKDKDKTESGKFTTQGVYKPDITISALKAFLDTLAPVARLTHLSSRASNPSPPNDTSAYHSGIAALGKLFPASSFSTKHDPRKLVAANAEKVNPATWIQVAEDHVVHRCFAVSKELGFFALVPPTTKTGDVLCVLLGGETPYVLRSDPKDANRYLFVGEAYVPGLMEDSVGLLASGSEFKRLRIR
ncbi:heterokaryon incompatibility protein-domain-containing protein [Schizothecium vesticola]|uniref:Heterokaryon incompatibility protein-domain-containing protein n=1 Tax=Schizothecium vesticola TaxID=314040 RepID=A0AA40EIE7_9PEZI|nr:heterokaryon incompatibility protein-domain-containing protein [Schizothecium vesticola]